MGSKGGVVSIVGTLISVQGNAPRREPSLLTLFLRKSLLSTELLLPSPGERKAMLMFSAVGLKIGEEAGCG